jgi:hypothetical protein
MTEDLGMVLRCKERIKAIEPNKDQRLQSPKSELHKENTILKSQLTKLQNQIPALSMILTQSQEGIPDSAEPFKVTTFNKICYEEEDAVIREELGGSDIRDETQRMSLLSAGILMPDYNEYRRQLSNWVKEYNKALGELSMSFNFNLYIKNTGGAPANNVEISLTFPKIFKLIYCENEHYGKEPILPEKPELPRSGLAAMVNYNDINKRIMYDPVLLQNINNDPWIKFSDNADSILLELDIKKVTHHSCSPFECVASLLSLENAHTFELEYTIIADNMPQKVNGKIPVIFELT